MNNSKLTKNLIHNQAGVFSFESMLTNCCSWGDIFADFVWNWMVSRFEQNDEEKDKQSETDAPVIRDGESVLFWFFFGTFYAHLKAKQKANSNDLQSNVHVTKQQNLVGLCAVSWLHHCIRLQQSNCCSGSIGEEKNPFQRLAHQALLATIDANSHAIRERARTQYTVEHVQKEKHV